MIPMVIMRWIVCHHCKEESDYYYPSIEEPFKCPNCKKLIILKVLKAEI